MGGRTLHLHSKLVQRPELCRGGVDSPNAGAMPGGVDSPNARQGRSVHGRVYGLAYPHSENTYRDTFPSIHHPS